MDPLAIAFGTALVGAMATDTWEQARAAVVALWHRIRSPQQAVGIGADLAALREQVMSAQQADRAGSVAALAGIWQGRLQELLLDKPDLAEQIRRVLTEELAPMLAPAERVRIGQIVMEGSSHDTSTFNQIAGDQVIPPVTAPRSAQPAERKQFDGGKGNGMRMEGSSHDGSTLNQIAGDQNNIFTVSTHSASPVVCTLPADTFAFAGRCDQLEQIKSAAVAAADAARVVAIHAIDGMPGVGKTTLAVHVAHPRRGASP